MKQVHVFAQTILAITLFASATLLGAATLDNGKLVSSWFDSGTLEFREADGIDYLWVRDGYSFEGKTIRFKEWGEPEFLGEGASDRDANDRRLARQMNSDMHRLFQEEWAGLQGVKTSLDKGDLVAEGRIVDCSTGNTAAKVLVGFGAGAGYTTIDLKVTERSSGKLVFAMHHRVVSGTSWSTTDSKFVKWVGKMVKKANKKGGFAGLYADASPRKN